MLIASKRNFMHWKYRSELEQYYDSEDSDNVVRLLNIDSD